MTNTTNATLVALLITLHGDNYITLNEDSALLPVAHEAITMGLVRRLAIITPSVHEFALTPAGKFAASLALAVAATV